MGTGDFVIRPIAETDARAVAACHYRGVYAFYDSDQDANDLAEPLDPADWGPAVFRGRRPRARARRSSST